MRGVHDMDALRKLVQESTDALNGLHHTGKTPAHRYYSAHVPH